MIKLNKDITDVPKSLIPAYADLFSPSRIPRKSQTTHMRRISVITAQSYTDDNNHNSRYKQDDIKIALKGIYHDKCAYCEQPIEQSQVEHYRPKSSYYWLAFSWDNLILACGGCNQVKGSHFDLNGTRVSFVNNAENIRAINVSSQGYDLIEQPLMVNPEVTDPLGLIDFDRDGTIFSDDDRFAYTIEKCSIDRIYLNDQRRTLLDNFTRDVTSILTENKDKEHQEIAIETIVRKFIRDSQDVKAPFLAFRRFAITKTWLNSIVKELN